MALPHEAGERLLDRHGIPHVACEIDPPDILDGVSDPKQSCGIGQIWLALLRLAEKHEQNEQDAGQEHACQKA